MLDGPPQPDPGTILKRLTYLHNGRRYRLTDVAGNHLTKVLA